MTLLYDNQISAGDLSSHNVLCSFPEFDGERYTRLPINSLLRLKNKGISIQQRLAEIELARREFVGADLPYEIDISHHAIDRLSTRYMHKYLNDNDGQGIVCWLKEKVFTCLNENGANKSLNAMDNCSVSYEGMQFMFKSHAKLSGRLVLVTVN
ncbi:hypothetical protein ACRN9G_18390 [Shewanella frigidimarina]|uniref:hypothetical protein n=1 Tax=Shewanella frigidimarina TaxID=56812 RepID=UPI003D7B07A7